MDKPATIVDTLAAGAPVLSPQEVHIWQIPLAASESAVSELGTVLSSEEQTRASKFHFERDRRSFIVSHGSLRKILAAYASAKPQQLRFACSKQGKPSLVDFGSDIRFSLSHSGELAAIAVTLEREVGVDVELIREDVETDKLAERFFSERERAAIRSLPEHKRVSAFFRCWTSKEAFLKAQGVGLSRSLNSFDVEVDPDQPARLVGTRPDAEEARRWKLTQIETRGGYAAALATGGEIGEIRVFALGPQGMCNNLHIREG